jgi:hypothetical protein
MGGPHFVTNWRPNTNTNDATGKFYPIMHYPPRLDADDRSIAVCFTLWGNPANGAWSIKFEDSVAGYAQQTMADGNNNANPPALSEFALPVYAEETVQVYDPPTGGAANLHQGDFKALEIETTNTLVGGLSIWHVENNQIGNTDAQVPVLLDDVIAGKIISESADSLLGLFEIIGDGSTDVESLERCSRRIYFNESHPTGILIAPGTAYHNIFNNFKYPARARDFADSDSERYSYPAFVIETDGVDAVNTCRIRVTTTCAADNVWTYEIDNGEPDNTPYLITPMGPTAGGGTGSDDVNGVRTESESDDEWLIEAETDAGVTLTIHSWLGAEGPAWS